MKPTDAARARQAEKPARRRAERARRNASAPFFFGKQAIAFAAVCVVLFVLDLFLYIGIAIYENTQAFGYGSPKSVTRAVGEALVQESDGAYALPADEADWMDYEQCWGMLLSEQGDVLWSRNAPDAVLHPYELSEVAVFSRSGYLNDFPCFVWKRDDGLLVTGFPKDSYAMSVVSYLPQESLGHMPLYALLIFVIDAAVLYLVYMVSKRRVAKSIAPMIEALDELARGKPVHVQLKGSLRDVGESINAASAVMRRKDEARRRWVSGVSHDVRTPLAISMGHAERIAADEAADDEARESARIIERQNARIRDLVSDLNIASKLEYDMQPVEARPARVAPLLRSIAADYANTYPEGPFVIEADVGDEARDAEALIDGRLMDRALRNLIDNAVRHNESGCTVRLFADARDGRLALGVADDGKGLDEALIARLNREAEAIASSADQEDEPAQGPVPPPHCDEYRAAAATGAPRTEPAASPCGEEPSLAPKDLVGLNEHGLGLSLVARIAAAHGGRVEFSSGPEGGFVATIAIPLHPFDTQRPAVMA